MIRPWESIEGQDLYDQIYDLIYEESCTALDRDSLNGEYSYRRGMFGLDLPLHLTNDSVYWSGLAPNYYRIQQGNGRGEPWP